MINIHDLVCPHVKNMKAYSSARMEYSGKEGIFLDANENSLGSVSSEIHNRYPDPMQLELKAELVKHYPAYIEQLFLGNGSDECINVLIQCFCIPGQDSILQFPPTFSMYEHASHVMNVKVDEILLHPQTFQLERAKVKAYVESHLHCKIIFLCSPNNPTGNLLNSDDIKFILENFKGIVVVDEAYQDFAGNVSWLHSLQDYPNLVVINTFSKAWGMADIRLGMLFANEEIIRYMNTIKMPYNISQHTINTAIEALHKTIKKHAFITALIEGRYYLEREFRAIPFIKYIFPSDTNFILIRVDDANALYSYLLDNKVIVRNRNQAPLLSGCLRISVGTMEENERLIEVLKNYGNDF